MLQRSLSSWRDQPREHWQAAAGASISAVAASASVRACYQTSLNGYFDCRCSNFLGDEVFDLETAHSGDYPMAKEPKQLDELFHDTLKDIYFAEKKILAALPRMAKAAQSEELSAAFEKHESETEAQVGRLEQVFQLLDESPKGKNCPAILGMIEEGKEIIADYKGSPALDAGLLSAAQSVEHYEIARYGTLIAWAKELNLNEAVPLLEATLEEEKATDQALTELAEAAINREAEAA
jgi:ferritin-like metal-binding protein YciE